MGALLGGYALLKLWEALRRLFQVLFPGSWAYGFFYMVVIVVFGLLWLVGVLLLEDYYRKGLTAGTLGKRMARITIIELVALLVPLLVGLILG